MLSSVISRLNSVQVCFCTRLDVCSWQAGGILLHYSPRPCAKYQTPDHVLSCGLFIPHFLWFPIRSAYIITLKRVSGTLGTCLCKFGNMPRNYILLRLYLLFALLTVFTSTSYLDAMSLIFILRLI